MSALKKYFDRSVNQSSPVKGDVRRVVKYDEEGNEFVTYEPVDYPTLQAEIGSVAMWSLNSLLAAGINPDFPIHTGNPTRLEGIGVIEQASAIADSLLADIENNEVKE